jgi:hypothetical protein
MWDRTRKLQPGKEYEPRDLTLISACTLNSTERRQNLMRVYTGLQLIGRITLKNEYSSEASLVTSLCRRNFWRSVNIEPLSSGDTFTNAMLC